jgi:hypothetical protein
MATRCKEKKKKKITPEKAKGMKLVCGKCGAFANKEKKLCKPKKNVDELGYAPMVEVLNGLPVSLARRVKEVTCPVSHSTYDIQYFNGLMVQGVSCFG